MNATVSVGQNNGPIAQFLDQIFVKAIQSGASDIHFETFLKKFVIRYRIDGNLVSEDNCDQAIAEPIILRLKLLANLNISEKRLPQDGSIEYQIDHKFIEFRISCLPTQFGESIVLRVLNNDISALTFDKILAKNIRLKKFLKNIATKSGLTLFVGPTGCGKSTTLYGVLREINSPELKILCCEDPVEQRIEGISQSNINSDVGFTFSSALRSFLRHDPDVIFVGEIRDKETATLAIRAAITGHCVLSTLHANSAIDAIPRLLDLGIDKFLIAESLICVVHQHLEYSAHSTRVNARNDELHGSGVRAIFDTIFIDHKMRQQIKSM